MCFRFNLIQRRTLAIMEDAGDACISTLMNSVARPRGEAYEIAVMRKALLGLLEGKMIGVCLGRDATTGRLVDLAEADGRGVIEDLPACLEWLESERGWAWGVEGPEAEIVLTPLGLAMAHQVQMEVGWPRMPLGDYNHE